jgi:glycosyltransferase involved in cell wall biosynthesis
LVSIIIPVYNDAERLPRCLEALEKQTYPENQYEVIVVDNGSDISPEPIVKQFGHARFAVERRPSSYAARNTGISLAPGEVMAFTDADCLPYPDWIKNGVAHLLRSPGCGLVGGKIELFFKTPARLTAVELYERLMTFRQEESIKHGQYSAGANLFTFKSVFARVGLFDPEIKSGGDIEWGQRVSSFGYELIYADDCCVAHPARSTFGQLYRRVTRLIGGFYDWNRKKPVHYRGLGRGFFIDALPPIRKSVAVWRSHDLKTLSDKIKVIAVLFFIQYVQVWERLRLMAGGTSRR